MAGVGLPHLADAIATAERCPVRRPDGGVYDFRRYAFGEQGTHLSHRLVVEIVDALVDSINLRFEAVDRIVSPEPGGHTWGMLVAYQLGLPLWVLRARPPMLADEVAVERHTAYFDGQLYFEPGEPGERLLVVDDVVSSGGTLRSIVGFLMRSSSVVVGAQVIVAKGTAARDPQARDLGVPLHFLALD